MEKKNELAEIKKILVTILSEVKKLNKTDNPIDSRNEDDLYEEAKAIVQKAGKASASLIQRKLRVGYARAARLLDVLEEDGIIGSENRSTLRNVISKK